MAEDSISAVAARVGLRQTLLRGWKGAGFWGSGTLGAAGAGAA